MQYLGYLVASRKCGIARSGYRCSVFLGTIMLSAITALLVFSPSFVRPSRLSSVQVISNNLSAFPGLARPDDEPLPALPSVATPQPSLDALANNLSGLMTQCDPEKYGSNLNYDSCDDVYKRLPRNVKTNSFGPRTSGSWDVRLPYRIVSCKYTGVSCGSLSARVHDTINVPKAAYSSRRYTYNRVQQMDCALLMYRHVLVSQFPTGRLGTT